jgi:hypothetical protein
MIRVTPRARRRGDRAGDPLDGLVNMFDLGIVLAVAFLLAALKSAGLTSILTDSGRAASGSQVPKDAVLVAPGQELKPLQPSGAQVAGRGAEVGSVYRLRDGRLVYVQKKPKP